MDVNLEGELIKGPIGDVGKYNLKFEKGQLVIEGDANLDKSSIGLILKIDAKQLLDALAKAIPGQLDDQVIKLIEAALLPV